MINTVWQSLRSRPLWQRLAQRAPAWLNVLIVLILGYWLADFVWALVPIKASPEAPPARVAASSSARVKVFHGARIAQKNLFGQSGTAPQSKKEITHAPKTRLDLVLRGVLAHTPAEKALAMISRGSGRQEVYAIGDKLPGDAELAEVHPDRVIIEYQGRYETLPLEKTRGVPIQSTGKTARPSKRPPSHVQNIDPSRASRLRREYLKNPAKLLSMVNIKQQRTDGKLVGFAIEPKGDASLFNQLGLQAGDVVMSVNGIPVSNTRAMNKLRNASRYDVLVLRSGMEIPLSLSFE